MEEIGDDTNLVLYFSAKVKGLVCNKTNANRIAHYFGDETDNWVGQTITLGVELVDYQGKTTELSASRELSGLPMTTNLPMQQPLPPNG